MRLLYFNPENDLALAANDPHYTPPASALQMAADLERLPLQYAEAGDVVLLRDGSFIDASAAPMSRFDLTALQALFPWGWSPLVVRELREAGVSDDFLPTREQLADYRAFASRQTAVRLLARLRDSWPEAWHEACLVGESSWCTTADAVAAVQSVYGRVMLKAPWSGSGRGVHPTAQLLTEKDWAWIRRTLKRQGGVEVEPIYNKVQDFAMEFWAEHGKVRYEGLSLFSTTDGGVYSGNLVASETEKERRLARYVSSERLRTLRDRLLVLLNDAGLPAWYTGPFGIDMMICQAPFPESSSLTREGLWEEPRPGGVAIHPLVELNLRMTMGWLAIQLSRQRPQEECRTFRILQQEGRYRYELRVLTD